MNIYLDLFISFAKIGMLTFGGGYAMLPMLTRVCVNEKQWTTEDELMEFFAIGQCTPGVIAVNTATFIGIKLKGNLGGIIATLGIVLPPLVLIIFIAEFLNNFSENIYLKYALSGIRIVVCSLITVTVFKLVIKSVLGAFTAVIFILSFTAAIFGISPIITVAAAAVSGITINTISKKNIKSK